MPRVKGGFVARRRRKKILKLAKGYFGSKHAIYRTAHEQVMRSLRYQYRDRKQRKRMFRKLWITRINAAAKLNGTKYSLLIHGLALANVQVNRKMLADIAVNEPQAFTAYCDLAKQAILGNLPKKVEKKVVDVKVENVDVADYSKMLVKELKALATEKGIEGADKMLKADLVSALEALN